MTTIFGGNRSSGYDVDNSLRFNDGSSDYLNRTSGTADSTRKFTISCWLKIGNISTYKSFFSSATTNPPFIDFSIQNDDEIQLDVRLASGTYQPETDRKFRDVSAWYHVVVSVDTTQGTEANRLKLYINGTQETTSAVGIPQNSDLPLSSVTYQIGRRAVGSDSYFDGYMAEYVFIDGSQLDPTSFGEFDADTGIWKPIDVSGLTFGNNGFYLDFENSGSLGADVSGNGNNFTVNNLTSIDQTTDTPTNNYCTLNPLDNYYCAGTFSNGNNTIVTGSSEYSYVRGTLGVSQGKWYYEAKAVATSSGNTWYSIGWSGNSPNGTTAPLGNQSDAVAYQGQNGTIRINTAETSTGTTFTTGDIIGTALDLDNNLVYFYKNGTLVNSGGTSITASASTTNGVWCPAVGDFDSTGTKTWSTNFGNPPFTISSGNSDGNSRGNFEYPVPSGYFALCTSNLSEHG